MYVLNPEIMEDTDFYTCNKYVAEWLGNFGIPIFSIKDRTYFFVRTERLKLNIEKMPLKIKLLSKLP